MGINLQPLAGRKNNPMMKIKPMVQPLYWTIRRAVVKSCQPIDDYFWLSNLFMALPIARPTFM